MEIPTQESLSGFVASDPELTFTKKGDARLHLRVGKPKVKFEEDGTITQLDPVFSDLVMFRRSAELAHDKFVKGDNFIAEGETRTYTAKDGTERKQFVASRIGHDNNTTRYTVDRTPRREATERETPAREEASREPAAREAVQQAAAAREAALEPDPEPSASTTSVQREAVTR